MTQMLISRNHAVGNELERLTALAFCGLLLLQSASPLGSPFRWAMYLLPLLTGAAYFAFRLQQFALGQPRLPDISARWLILVVCFFLFSVLTNAANAQPFDIYFFRDALFYGIPLLLAGFIHRVEERQIWAIAWASCLAIGIAFATGNALSQEWSFFSSSSPLESAYVFPLWLCILALLMSRRGGVSVFIFLAIAVLSLKRIAVAAALLSYLAFLFCRFCFAGASKQTQQLAARSMVLVSLPIVLVVGYYFIDIIDYFHQNIARIYLDSPEEVLLGRHHMQSSVKYLSGQDASWFTLLFGHGAGHTSRLFDSIKDNQDVRYIHNDMLRLILELGLLSALALVVLLALVTRTVAQACLVLFQSLLMLTDNTMSYVFHTVPMIFCFRYLAHCELSEGSLPWHRYQAKLSPRFMPRGR